MGTEEDFLLVSPASWEDLGSSSPWTTGASFRKAKALCGALWLVLLLHGLPLICSVTCLGSTGKKNLQESQLSLPFWKSCTEELLEGKRITNGICSVLRDPTSCVPWVAFQQHLQFWGIPSSQAVGSHGQCQASGGQRRAGGRSSCLPERRIQPASKGRLTHP